MPIPLIAAAGVAAGGAYLGQRSANIATRKMAREQMRFQERMSGTAYQRAVKDMKLAGINPMLAYQQGGASTPGGAMAEMKSTLGPAVSSAQAVTRMGAEIKAIGAGIAKTQAETRLIDENTTSARVRATRAQVFEPALDVGVGMARDLFDPRHRRIIGYEAKRVGGKIKRSFKRFRSRFPVIGPNTTRRR